MLHERKPDVLQGASAHGPQTLERGIRGIARRIAQVSGDLLTLNQGTLYPLLLKLEHEGSIVSQWGASETSRARFYRFTVTGRKQLQTETRDWNRTALIIARFFEVKAPRVKAEDVVP